MCGGCNPSSVDMGCFVMKPEIVRFYEHIIPDMVEGRGSQDSYDPTGCAPALKDTRANKHEYTYS